MSLAFAAPIMTYNRFELNPNFKNDGQGLLAELHFHHTLNRLEGAKEATVALRLQINQKKDERLEDAPFWLEVEYAAQFMWEEDMTPKEIEQLLRINASAVLIGYIRPMVAIMTSSSPLPTYNLPFINVNDLFGAQKADISL